MKKAQSPGKILKCLRQSLTDQVPVDIARHVDRGAWVNGLVLDIGERWILLAALRDRAYFDGFTVLRLKDIRRVKLDATFLPALRKQEAWPPSCPAEGLDLSGPAAFLPEIARRERVLVWHEEHRQPDMLWIAAPDNVRRKSMSARVIDPDCAWSEVLIKAKYKHLTRVDFGDDYSAAVLAVAGKLPEAPG